METDQSLHFTPRCKTDVGLCKWKRAGLKSSSKFTAGINVGRLASYHSRAPEVQFTVGGRAKSVRAVCEEGGGAEICRVLNAELTPQELLKVLCA